MKVSDKKIKSRYTGRSSYIQDGLLVVAILILTSFIYSSSSSTVVTTNPPVLEILCVYADNGSLTGVVKVKEILSTTDNYVIFKELTSGQTIKLTGTFVITTSARCPHIGRYPSELQ